MEASVDVRDAMLRFYEGVSTSDVASFDSIVSPEAVVVIGTAPGELVTERDRMRFGFEAEGLRIEAGHPEGFEEGSMGWVVDEPMFFFPGDVAVATRLTGVFHRHEGSWMLVHMHVPVGVPDEEVAELQQRWSAAG
jgi:SnoaL-like domain